MNGEQLELFKITGLPVIAETISKLISTIPGMITLSVFALFVLLVKVPQVPLIRSFSQRKITRLKMLQEHLSTSTDELFCKSVVEDVRNAIIFEQATKIYAENTWRQGLVDLHDKARVSWVTMKRAHRFMDIALDGTVFLKDFTLANKADRIFNFLMTWIFLLLAAIVIIAGFVFSPSWASTSQAMLLGLFFFCVAVMAAFQNLPADAATQIKKRLEQYTPQAES